MMDDVILRKYTFDDDKQMKKTSDVSLEELNLIITINVGFFNFLVTSSFQAQISNFYFCIVKFRFFFFFLFVRLIPI